MPDPSPTAPDLPGDLLRTLEQSGPFLRRLAASLVRDPREAEDAVQETFARALAGPRPQQVDRPRSWLATVLRNVVANRTARATARGRASDAVETLPLPGSDPEAIHLRLDAEAGAADRQHCEDPSSSGGLLGSGR